MQHKSPLVGVGACLVGKPVRFNGDHKRRNSHIEKLAEHCELKPFCPEVGIGLGVPREPIRIVDDGITLTLRDSNTQTRDYSEAIQAYAQALLQQNSGMCGYVLVKGSPSCGLERVKRYNKQGQVIAADTGGMFTRELLRLDSLLPVEEDGRLYDHGLRESFVSRVFLYHDWKQLQGESLTAKNLVDFYSRYKYLVMAHSVAHYQQIGRLLSDLKNADLRITAQTLITLLMSALKKVATVKGHVNVMQHLQGYLKNQLSPNQKQELGAVIKDYHRGIVPLITPMTLLQHHFNRNPNAYIAKQRFMQPYPNELALRSFII